MKASTKTNSPDGFVCPPDNPRATEHALLSDVLKSPSTSTLPAESVKLDKAAQVALLLAAMERLEFQKKKGKPAPALSELIKKLAGRKMTFTEEQLVWSLDCAATISAPKDAEHVQFEEFESPIPGVVPMLLDQVEMGWKKALPKLLLEAVGRLHAALKPMEFWGGYKRTVQRLEGLRTQTTAGLPDDGDSWAEAIRQDIEKIPPKKRQKWLALLQNAPKGTTAKPTAHWKKQADELLAAVGHEEFARQIEQWFGLVGLKASARIQPRNAALLRALVWYASLLTGETVCRALANAVEGGLRKFTGGSLYASSISKACIAALEAMPGLEPVAQLCRLRHRVKSPWGLEEIEKALGNAVLRSGMSRAEIEEISLPTFGLDQAGTLRRQLGECSALLSIVGTLDVALKWLDAAGKELEEKPAVPKKHAGDEKALKQLAKDIEKMLGAQRDRVENFLERGRAWPFTTWKARYLEHPLMSNLTRRLIWQFQEGEKSGSGIWREGAFVQANGQPLKWLRPKTEVQLWHPLGMDPADVQAWRRWLEGEEVSQPFKQAHREIYVLTDAERTTGTYSNRFAAHILRQHQFKALCEQRGWKSSFLGSWDPGDATPTRDLAGWGMRAEFWVEAAGDEFSPAGVALHVATDKVRFVRADDEEVPLAAVPPLVFSEVMRDVDLFVSVCSVGNDPEWVDGGREPQRGYWREWAFGSLNATAETRHGILERLLPKLRIAAQCTLRERFLVVRGQLETYKIHLGSGNILMEPNDQYLCIVPNRKASSREENAKVFLPFEGDGTLSVILSKAFLLAEDEKIEDETILKQIQRATGR
jgi:hypothetical protein